MVETTIEAAVRPTAGSAAALRQATLDVHRRAEEEPFIDDLMGGRRSRGDFRRLTGQLRHIYAALEEAVGGMRAEGRLDRFLDPRLDRLATIDHDLAALGPAEDDAATPNDAAAAYSGRIRAVAGSEPRLLAHHYVRYLGDLSGGQIIATLMRRHYDIPADALTFYAFDGLGSKGAYKIAYRRALDTVLADPAFYAEVVDESRAAYEANRQVFAELGRAG
jgi:heme oxygenase